MKNPTNPKASANTGSLSDSLSTSFAAFAIPICMAAAYLIYIFVLGSPSNFAGGDVNSHPINALGTVHAGGIAIVPLLIGCLIMTITFILERFFTISKASGKGATVAFVNKIRSLVSRGEIDQAIVECDKQKGSVANVVRSGLVKYKEMDNNTTMEQERKLLAIQKDIEETTQLEMPMLERNLVVIATIASIATLLGLLGTVIGMINAFSALANAGAPDAVKLASGISEALINTALGIGTSALAIIFYNFFTSKIDGLTYGIDEASYSITQTFASKANATAKSY